MSLAIEWWLFALTVLLTCSGQVLQKHAAGRWQTHGLFLQPAFWAAVICLGLASLSWLLLLQQWPVGKAYPLLSINFALMLLIARFVFNETVLPRHWLGVCLVISGICLLGIS